MYSSQQIYEAGTLIVFMLQVETEAQKVSSVCSWSHRSLAWEPSLSGPNPILYTLSTTFLTFRALIIITPVANLYWYLEHSMRCYKHLVSTITVVILHLFVGSWLYDSSSCSHSYSYPVSFIPTTEYWLRTGSLRTVNLRCKWMSTAAMMIIHCIGLVVTLTDAIWSQSLESASICFKLLKNQLEREKIQGWVQLTWLFTYWREKKGTHNVFLE